MGFLYGQLIHTICFGNYKIMNTEVILSRMYLRGSCVSKDCFKAYSKFADVCWIIPFIAVTNACDGCHIIQRK